MTRIVVLMGLVAMALFATAGVMTADTPAAHGHGAVQCAEGDHSQCQKGDDGQCLKGEDGHCKKNDAPKCKDGNGECKKDDGGTCKKKDGGGKRGGCGRRGQQGETSAPQEGRHHH